MYFLHSAREYLLWCWGFNTGWWTRTSASDQNECGWRAVLKSVTGTAGTPWSCQEVGWSQCYFGELLTWRPGPITMSVWGLMHSRAVWSPVSSALLEKVSVTITGQGYASMRSSVKHAHKCLSTFPTWSSLHHPVTGHMNETDRRETVCPPLHIRCFLAFAGFVSSANTSDLP